MDESISPAEGKARHSAHLFCLQLGSKTMRTFNDEDAEKGHAFFDVFAMADLEALPVKEVEPEQAKPKNGKRSRVEHTTNQIGKTPKSSMTNSSTEELLLKYLEGVNAAFTELYRHRRPLYTHPKNECGVHKCVCTTVCSRAAHFGVPVG